MISSEKRAFKRAKHKFTVRFKRHGDASVGGASVTENISLGGAYFSSLEKFDIGQLLDCRIDTGVAGEFVWLGRVVRCDELGNHMVRTYGIAVEFVKADPDSERRLKAVL